MTGTLLADAEIWQVIASGELKISPKNRFAATPTWAKDSPVQPSSLDLTVGKIMVPPQVVDQQAQQQRPPLMMKAFSIDPGATVVVETFEEIDLSASLAAFGFPPAHLSRNAILMTNPGHVDPGYQGKLSFTLINMGRDTYYLEEGQPIVSLMIFRFSTSSDVHSDYATRFGTSAGQRDYWAILNRLSPDFASISGRIKDEAGAAIKANLSEFDKRSDEAIQTLKEAEHKFDLSKLWVPAVVALITVLGVRTIEPFVGGDYAKASTVTSLNDRVNNLSRQVVTAASETKFNDRLHKLETEVMQIEKRNSENGK